MLWRSWKIFMRVLQGIYMRQGSPGSISIAAAVSWKARPNMKMDPTARDSPVWEPASGKVGWLAGWLAGWASPVKVQALPGWLLPIHL